MQKEKEKISDSLSKLEKIVSWFSSQNEVDVEEGLEKVKEGAVLIKDLKERLKNVENEFQEIKKDLSGEEE
ncbi:MAG: exodeoxyribonuclease VII small subunit [Patescibacteria group bacterium]|nr:exodeoxyribonuclease VII small subunit [Patescibacteria group bacterium]MDE2438592.1 exodeoxyribonuclease VII small subunit [Patescibacteria group bacterium]